MGDLVGQLAGDHVLALGGGAALVDHEVVLNPLTNRIYIAGPAAAVTVIDGVTNHIVTVPTGAQPTAMAVDSATNRVYVVSTAHGTVTTIDGATNRTNTIAA